MIFITSFVLLVSILATFVPFLNAIPISSDALSARDNSFADIAAYLYAHNVVRLAHGADALSWSQGLADGAQKWADACHFAHTDGVLSSDPYGENLAAATGNFPISSAVQSFLSDGADFDPSSPTFSDWTQIVWKGTTSVGCASSQCSGIFDSSLGKATLHVCLYNPPGNVVGEAAANVQL